jgi:hypothetical protein
MKNNSYHQQKLTLLFFLIGSSIAFAQIVTKTAVDNKGTKNTVLDAQTTVITTAGNGLSVDVTTATNPKVELGGTLDQATTTINTLGNALTIDATGGTFNVDATGGAVNVTGLATGDLATDQIVVTTPTGELKKVSSSTLLTSGNQSFNAVVAQGNYPIANLPADASRVWVYRNGVKLIAGTDFVAAAGSITLQAPIVPLLVATDDLEVQWVK